MKKLIDYTAYFIYKKLSKYLFKRRYIEEKHNTVDPDFWGEFYD